MCLMSSLTVSPHPFFYVICVLCQLAAPNKLNEWPIISNCPWRFFLNWRLKLITPNDRFTKQFLAHRSRIIKTHVQFKFSIITLYRNDPRLETFWELDRNFARAMLINMSHSRNLQYLHRSMAMKYVVIFLRALKFRLVGYTLRHIEWVTEVSEFSWQEEPKDFNEMLNFVN